jgi:hypothetical protein
MNGMFGIENGGALIRAAPLGLLGFGGIRTQGCATFAASRRCTLGWHRYVPLALKIRRVSSQVRSAA